MLHVSRVTLCGQGDGRPVEESDFPEKRNSAAHRLRAWLAGQIETLYPGSFALVMATGIISNALFFEAPRALSDALFVGNLVAYSLLTIFIMLRALWFWRALWADLVNPRLVFSFFTIVAGTDVLGVGIHLRGFESVAAALWLFALIGWFLLIYFSFGVLTFLNTPGGADVLDGGWLMAIVGTESLVLLGAVIAPTLGDLGPSVFLLIHLFWGLGLALYGVFIVIFSYRIFFFAITPDDVTPSWWVVMGAAAISANAGSILVLTDSKIASLQSMRPFIEGITPIIWTWATWWILPLVSFGIWKHIVCRVPLNYTPALWSLVFPLGMYALASLRVSLAADFPPLQSLSHTMLWIALIAWAATASGLAAAAWRSFRADAGSGDVGPARSRES
jgi:tellurite resistance protein TehA-like permease